MDKETDALLKIARERENKKDLLAYQKLKEISTGRTYSEVQDIIDRMGKQLSRWVGATPCQPNRRQRVERSVNHCEHLKKLQRSSRKWQT